MFAESRTPAGHITITCLACTAHHTGTPHTALNFARDHDCPRKDAA